MRVREACSARHIPYMDTEREPLLQIDILRTCLQKAGTAIRISQSCVAENACTRRTSGVYSVSEGQSQLKYAFNGSDGNLTPDWEARYDTNEGLFSFPQT